MSNNEKRKTDICILHDDSETLATWIRELNVLKQGLGGALSGHITGVDSGIAPVIFIDAATEGWQEWAQGLDRDDKSVILVIQENDFLPNAADLKHADDLLVYPFRMAEVLSVYRHHHYRLAQQQLMTEVVEAEMAMNDANQTLERILQSKTPRRHQNIKGIQVMSRHLSGLKPGGDYFDIFESDKRDFVNLLLVDSSTYGISAALLGMILSSSARIANDAQLSTSDWVRTIYNELKVTLGESGHFSVFFGRINRRDFSLHYQLYGSIAAFKVEKDGVSTSLMKHGEAITESKAPANAAETVVTLNPKDRLVLLSDGFVSGVGEFHLHKIFSEKLEQEPFSLVNELSFQIKSKLNKGETFPGEDCSAIVIDVENRVLRLAPTG